MELDELIHKVNQCVEDLDFFSARKYIEENLDALDSYKSLLKSNAREILKFIQERQKSGYKPLTRQELATINTINSYAYHFDLRGIKLVLKSKAKLFLRDDIITYLNKDAQEILKGMGTI